MSRHLNLKGKIAFYDNNQKSVEIEINKMHYTIISNLVMLFGVLTFFTFKGLEWNEISNSHLSAIVFINLITLGVGFYLFRISKTKDSIIIDGNKKYILKGKMGIPFEKIRGLAIETIAHDDEYEVSYSYALTVHFKDRTRLLLAEDKEKDDLNVLRSWIKELI